MTTLNIAQDVKKVFVNPPSSYKRDLDVVGHYREQGAHYLHKMTGHPIEECAAYVERRVSSDYDDPRIRYLERGANGDRSIKYGTIGTYLEHSIKRNQLIAATLTTYHHPDILESPYVPYIDNNVRLRGYHKKRMFSAEQRKDWTEYVIEKNNQANKKISNNSLSGAHNSTGTPLWNKTAHSTLTSTCRVTSGYGNANNERLVIGNRFYHNYSIALNNINSIVCNTDYDVLMEVMNKYRLVHPTVDDIMQMVADSAECFWRNKRDMELIKSFVMKLTPIERAAALYTGDFYHIAKLNPEMSRKMILAISEKKYTTHQAETYMDFIHTFPEDIINLAKQICRAETADLEKLQDIEGTDKIRAVAATTENIARVLCEYSDFIRCFFVTDNLPPSVGYLNRAVRKIAITSDTDSTIFTVEHWVEFVTGKIGFDDIHMNVAATMIFFASQTITHILAIMSANFGVIEKRIHQIAMKNEFKFDVFVATQMTKHYFAAISAQEGNVRSKHKIEIKGVHMRSSNAPIHINEAAKQMMVDIMDTVMRCELISINEYLTRVAEMERMVEREMIAGNVAYFRRCKVNDSTAYTKGPLQSNYAYHDLWEEVFAPKYGSTPPTPWNGVRISLSIDKPAAFREYIATLEDRELAGRFAAWMQKANRDSMGSFLINRDVIVRNGGIPKELVKAMDMKAMVFNICTIFYHILETLGDYQPRRGQNHLPILVSDMY